MNPRITTHPPAEDARRLDLEKLGGAAFLMARVRHHGLRSNWARNWLEPAITFRQFALYYDAFGAPTAYLAWAYLERDVTQRLLASPQSQLHVSEWSEGKQPCIVDFVATGTSLRDVLSHTSQHLFAECSRVDYLRRASDGGVRRLGSVKNRFYGKRGDDVAI